jgi:hypothetical protein
MHKIRADPHRLIGNRTEVFLMRIKSCLVSLFMIFALSVAASAAEIRGVIVKTDAAKNQLTIEGRGLGVRGAVVTFQLDKDTQIQAGRKLATLTDLTPGGRVRVVYDFRGDQRMALLIMLQGSPPGPAAPAFSGTVSANGVSGILRRVSYTEREIVIVSPAGKEGAEVETVVSVPEDAKIAKDQKAIPFDDLKEGDQVVVQVEKRDNKLSAKVIQLGATANANPNPESGKNNIKQIRNALKMVDFILQMLDQKSR